MAKRQTVDERFPTQEEFDAWQDDEDEAAASTTFVPTVDELREQVDDRLNALEEALGEAKLVAEDLQHLLRHAKVGDSRRIAAYMDAYTIPHLTMYLEDERQFGSLGDLRQQVKDAFELSEDEGE